MPDLVEQLRQLSQLHANGSLSDSEFEKAKQRLLNSEPPSQSSTSTSLLALQNELAAIDRQWTIEREKYKVAGRYNSSIPEQGDGTKGGIAIAIFGGIWTVVAIGMAIAASSSGAPGPLDAFFWLFPVFGVVFVIAGLSQSSKVDRKADEYVQAEEEYKARRAQLEAKIRQHS